MFSALGWNYVPDPDELDFAGAATDRSAPGPTYDHSALDSIPNHFDDEYGDGDLEAEREHEILLLKAYTGQLDEELKQTNLPSEPSTSPTLTSDTPKTPETSKTNQLLGIRSAPGELLIRTSRRRDATSDDSASDGIDIQDDDEDDRGVDDLKLSRRVSPFASASKRRKLNEPKRKTDVFVVDDSDSSGDERAPAPRRTAISVSSSSGSDSDEEKPISTTRDVLLEATNALHAVHGHKSWEDLPPLFIPKELDFSNSSKSTPAKKSKLNDDSDSEDGLTMPTVVDSRTSGSQQNRYFGDDFGPGACFRCGMLGHLAADCEAKQRMCYMCGMPEHKERRCPNTLCFNCYLPGHAARDCTNPRAPRAPCTRCGRSGHRSFACLDANRTTKSCFNCGARGHSGIECRERPVEDFARIKDRLDRIRDMALDVRRHSLDAEEDYERRQRRDRETQNYRDRFSNAAPSKHTFFDESEYEDKKKKHQPQKQNGHKEAERNKKAAADDDEDYTAYDLTLSKYEKRNADSRPQQKQQQQQQNQRSVSSTQQSKKNGAFSSTHDGYVPSSGEEDSSDSLDSFGLDDFSEASDEESMEATPSKGSKFNKNGKKRPRAKPPSSGASNKRPGKKETPKGGNNQKKNKKNKPKKNKKSGGAAGNKGGNQKSYGPPKRS